MSEIDGRLGKIPTKSSTKEMYIKGCSTSFLSQDCIFSSINEWYSFLGVEYKYTTFICRHCVKEDCTIESCWSVTEAWVHSIIQKYHHLSLQSNLCKLLDFPYTFLQSSVFPSLTELLAAPPLAVDVEVEEAGSLGWKAKEAELMQ